MPHNWTIGEMPEDATLKPTGAGDTQASILHVDLDAFFVSAELLRRPELAGRPVVVGGAGRRGVVAAASYEARYYGLSSGMPSAQARRLCPQAEFIPGDHDYYEGIWTRVKEVLRSFTPLVEAVSADEAFMDVSGSQLRFGCSLEIGHRIRADVLAQEGLNCSVGVASNKLLAKLASRRAKPRPGADCLIPGRGVVHIPPSGEKAFLNPMALEEMWGVGASTLRKLERMGLRTVADLAEISLTALAEVFGNAHGQHLHNIARGIDESPVVPYRPPKSMSSEVTFATDVSSVDELEKEILRQSEALARRLRKAGCSARTVVLKLRHPDFRTLTRSRTLKGPTRHGALICREARFLLREYLGGLRQGFEGFRLMGVGVSGLSFNEPVQMSLDGEELSSEALDEAVDSIRSRFGDEAVAPAALLEYNRQRGAWGPDASA